MATYLSKLWFWKIYFISYTCKFLLTFDILFWYIRNNNSTSSSHLLCNEDWSNRKNNWKNYTQDNTSWYYIQDDVSYKFHTCQHFNVMPHPRWCLLQKNKSLKRDINMTFPKSNVTKTTSAVNSFHATPGQFRKFFFTTFVKKSPKNNAN